MPKFVELTVDVARTLDSIHKEHVNQSILWLLVPYEALPPEEQDGRVPIVYQMDVINN